MNHIAIALLAGLFVGCTSPHPHLASTNLQPQLATPTAPHPRTARMANTDRIMPVLTELTLGPAESHEFVFHRLNYQGPADVLPQVMVYLGKGQDQIEAGQHFRVELFADHFGQAPFATITPPCVSISIAEPPAWQDHQGALRLTVITGTIRFTTISVEVYTGSELYHLDLVAPCLSVLPGK